VKNDFGLHEFPKQATSDGRGEFSQGYDSGQNDINLSLAVQAFDHDANEKAEAVLSF
jgi:hypothetical protein